MVKVIFHLQRPALKEKEFASFWEHIPLREVPILKRDAIEESHCLVCITFSGFWLSSCYLLIADSFISINLPSIMDMPP